MRIATAKAATDQASAARPSGPAARPLSIAWRMISGIASWVPVKTRTAMTATSICVRYGRTKPQIRRTIWASKARPNISSSMRCEPTTA